MFDDARLYSKQQFVAYFMQQLHLTSDDIVIIDRSTKVGQAILENKGPSKVGIVVHAEHYSENSTDDTHILWNNFYEYVFSKAPFIDFILRPQIYKIKSYLSNLKIHIISTTNTHDSSRQFATA